MNINRNKSSLTLRAFAGAAFYAAVLLVLFAGANVSVNAQTPAELAAGSFTSANGPTTANQTSRLLLNTTGTTYTTPTSTVQVTAAVSNQQYTGDGTGTGNPVLMFGGTSTTNGNNVTSRPANAAMNDIATPVNTQFSNAANGAATGIDVATNQAFNMYLSINHWSGATTPATNSRVRMADLTFTFNTPLTNPLMHVVGLGGASTTANGVLGFSAEMDLITPNITLAKVTGNTTLNVTATNQINNNLTSGMNGSCATADNVAGCGTIRLVGTNIQSVTFRVYIRGDGVLPVWGAAANHPGDQFLVGFSIPETYNISGNVFNDTTNDNTVNGSSTSTAGTSQLYANLIEPISGRVFGVAAISGGAYSFNGIPSNLNLRVDISTVQGVVGSAAPARSLPAGWIYTGENVGTAAGSDGNADGGLSRTVTANTTNMNFGIRLLGTTAAQVTVSGRVLTAEGNGISNVRVQLTDALGETRTGKTNQFGYYVFDNVRAGEVFVLRAVDKRYQFQLPTRVEYIAEDVDGIDFVAYPQ